MYIWLMVAFQASLNIHKSIILDTLSNNGTNAMVACRETLMSPQKIIWKNVTLGANFTNQFFIHSYCKQLFCFVKVQFPNSIPVVVNLDLTLNFVTSYDGPSTTAVFVGRRACFTCGRVLVVLG